MDRGMWMMLPIRRILWYADNSLRSLELECLIACIRIVKAKRIFEFGTFRGTSTLHMAMNSPEDARIWTLDADDETLAKSGMLDVYDWRSQFPLEFSGTPGERKITCLIGDSRIFDAFPRDMDLVFIDGDHTTAGVKCDTRNAENILNYQRTGCILWHDYQNSECQENTAFLDGLAENRDLFHVEDTMLAIRFCDPVTIERLKAL